MRRLILAVLILVRLLGICFADASFEVISKDIDSNGNIRVWTAHKVDGVEVASQYPKINDHFVWATRYSKQNFIDCKDKAKIEAKILDDIKNYSNVLIRQEYDKKADKTVNQMRVDYNSQANTAFMDSNLSDLVGKKATVTQTVEKFDTDNDGVLDKEVTIKSDGTKTESVIAVQ